MKRMRMVLWGIFLCAMGMSARGETTGPGWRWVSAPQDGAPEPAPILSEGGPTLETLDVVSGEGVGIQSEESGGVSNLVAETARALGYDSRRLYEFVRNETAFVPYYGLRRSPERTLLDRCGNDADQAWLLVKLLRASGFGTNNGVKVTGELDGFTNVEHRAGFKMSSSDGYDLPHWLGVSNDVNQVRAVLQNAGYPLVTNVADATYPFRFPHFWVVFWDESGQRREVDPSFKPSTATAGADVTGMCNYNRTSLYSAAGGTTTADYVQSLNETNVGNYLNGLAGTLLGSLHTNHPNTSWTQLMGGRRIVTETVDEWTGDLLRFDRPSQLATNKCAYDRLWIEHDNLTVLMYPYQKSHQKLWIDYVGSGYPLARFWDQDYNYSTETGTVSSAEAAVTITYETYPYQKFTLTSTYTLVRNTNHVYVIGMGFGGNGNGAMADVAFREIEKRNAGGAADNDHHKISASLQAIGQKWLEETDQFSAINQSITGVRENLQHRVGIIAQETGYYVDFADGVTSAYDTNDFSTMRSVGFMDSAMEHGVLEQLQHTNRPAASTIKLICKGNAAGQKTFRATSSNWNTVKSQLTGYGASTNTFASLVASNHVLILPQSGQIAVSNWTGTGYVDKLDVGGTNSIGMIIGGSYNGGYGGVQAPVYFPPIVEAAAYVNTFDYNQPSYTSLDPVDLLTGSFLNNTTDLTVDGPMGLTLSRHYTSSARNRQGPLGYGWTHSYDMKAQLHSDTAASLGRRAPQDASAALVAAVVLKDLFANEDTPKSWAVAALVANWAVNQITDHSVSVLLGQKAMTFNRQPDGSYTAPPGMTTSLIKSNNLYVLQERLGNTYTFSATNRLSKIQNPDGNTLTFAYNSSTNLTSVTSGFGSKSLTFAYGTSNLVSSVTDHDSRSVSYLYDAAGNLTNVTDAASYKWALGYDAQHRLVWLKDPENTLTVSNAYNSLDQVTNQISALGQPWKFSTTGRQAIEESPFGTKTIHVFDDDGRATSVMAADGATTFAAYDGQGHTTWTVDARGVTNRFVYDGHHNLTRAIAAEGTTEPRITDHAYDSQYRLIAVTNAVGAALQQVTRREYDSEHHLTKLTNPLGEETTYAYFANGLPQTMQRKAGGLTLSTTTYTYDSKGFPQTVASTDAGTVGLAYDAVGNCIRTTNALNKVTQVFYDKRRLVTNTVDALNASSKRSYYNHGLLKHDINALNQTNTHTWTASYQPRALAYPDGGLLTNVYDAADRLIATRNPRQYWTTNRYDVVGRVTNTIFGTSRRSCSYDANGNVLSSWNALGHTTVNDYNAHNQLTQQQSPIGLQQFHYDALGRVTNTVDAMNHPWRSQYDALGRKTAGIRPSGATEGFGYNGLGFRTSFTNAEGRVTRFGFDAQGRLQAVTNSLGQVTRFGYDLAGNQTSRTNADAVVTQYLYDSVNRLTNTVYADGHLAKLAYDLNGNMTNAQRTGLAPVSLSLRYDTRNRLTNATTTVTNVTWNVGYQHDLHGNTTNLVYPGGLNVAYTFDPEDRVASVTFSNLTTSFTYDAAGRMTSITYPNGVNASFTHDAMNRLTHSTYAKGSAFINRTLLRNDLGHKTQENIDAGYAPAPLTKRIRANTFNEADRLIGSSDTQGAVSYSYDAKGNQTLISNQWSGVSYGWDEDNRLTSVAQASLPVTAYQYDALGSRVATITGSGTNYFAVNPSAGLKNVLVEMNGAGVVTRSYIWGPSGLIAHMDADGTTRFYHADEQGSTLALTDSGGNVTDQFAYTPGGELINRTGTTSTPYQWLGGVAVRAEGDSLYYMLNRYYSSDQKRFLSEDPAGIDSFPNLYAYANANPLFFSDPYGLCAEPGRLEQVIDSTFAWGGFIVENLLQGMAAPFAWVQENMLDPMGWTVEQQVNLAVSTPIPDDAVAAIWGGVVRFGSEAAILNRAVPAAESTALSTYRLTTAGERFSHYGYVEDAARFQGGLRPGGFATSVEGLSGASAQSGLALPAGRPVPNANYTITPTPGTAIRVNPVTQPLYPRPGGLPEVEFYMGTRPGTVSPPTRIP